MKYIFIFLFGLLFRSSIGYGQVLMTPKTDIFQKYQQVNAFKGIKFGSIFSEASEKMHLIKESAGIYDIRNEEYLYYNNFKFFRGQAYFTKSGKLYQVVLYLDNITNAKYIYNNLKSDLIGLFGENDGENKLSNNSTSLSISWHGVNIDVLLDASFESKVSGVGNVSLMIINNELNDVNLTEVLQKQESKIPKFWS